MAPGSSVLEIGAGSGRNLATLIETMNVAAVDDAAERIKALQAKFEQGAARILHAPYNRMPFSDRSFDAVLSTHALLHGTAADVQGVLYEIARVSRPDALLFATFGSQRDARFGEGTRVDEQSFAPVNGDEAGVTHSYFTERELREVLQNFEIERLEEIRVDQIAGRWAHPHTPLRGAVHWFTTLKVLSR